MQHLQIPFGFASSDADHLEYILRHGSCPWRNSADAVYRQAARNLKWRRLDPEALDIAAGQSPDLGGSSRTEISKGLYVTRMTGRSIAKASLLVAD